MGSQTKAGRRLLLQLIVIGARGLGGDLGGGRRYLEPKKQTIGIEPNLFHSPENLRIQTQLTR